MGSVVLKWQDPSCKLLLTQFTGGRVIKEATWWNEDDKTKDIFGARDEKTGGTLFACSKLGRVACLVNTNELSPPSFGNGEAEMLPVKFLKGEMSPEDFANDLKSNKDLCPDLTFYLLVADLPLSSMFYISKKYMSKEIDEIRVVTSGSHGLYDTGLNDYDLTFHNGQEEDFGYTSVKVKPTGEVRFFEVLIVNGDEKYKVIEFNMDVKPTGK